MSVKNATGCVKIKLIIIWLYYLEKDIKIRVDMIGTITNAHNIEND